MTRRGRKPSLSGADGGALLAWFDREKRDLPWRLTRDPYAIWVSEIMLQQTQVATVVPYFDRWMERFPTVQSLAAADEQDVLSLWQGLGYYRRCRLLLKGARWVVENGLPTTADAWLDVPGVGRYTAGAIASIAFDVATPVVDGNVERVYARLSGDEAAGKELHAAAWKWAERNLFKSRPGDWNQALMELGATVCKPVEPSCEVCPLADRCVALQSWRVNSLPTKALKVKTVRLHHVVWVPVFERQVGLRQVPAGQWWEGMWEFPRADYDGTVEQTPLRALVGPGWPESVGLVRHSVTQHRILIDVSVVRCETKTEQLRWLPIGDLDAIPMPAPQRKILRLVRALFEC